MDIDVTSGFPMEMHAVFIMWFMWGFWAKIALLAALLVGFIAYKMGYEGCGRINGWVSGGLYTAQGIIWLGLGGVWRYSKSGMVASGDELAKKTGTSDEAWA